MFIPKGSLLVVVFVVKLIEKLKRILLKSNENIFPPSKIPEIQASSLDRRLPITLCCTTTLTCQYRTQVPYRIFARISSAHDPVTARLTHHHVIAFSIWFRGWTTQTNTGWTFLLMIMMLMICQWKWCQIMMTCIVAGPASNVPKYIILSRNKEEEQKEDEDISSRVAKQEVALMNLQ